MTTPEIIYLTILALIIIAGSAGDGWITRLIWFKITKVIEKAQKWQEKNGKL